MGPSFAEASEDKAWGMEHGVLSSPPGRVPIAIGKGWVFQVQCPMFQGFRVSGFQGFRGLVSAMSYFLFWQE